MAVADKDILYAVAYEEAVRALSEQQAVAILWLRRWEFTANPRDLIHTYIEADQPAPIEEVHRDLSLHMHNSYVENRKGLEQWVVCFQLAAGLLAVEVVVWIMAIASSP